MNIQKIEEQKYILSFLIRASLGPSFFKLNIRLWNHKLKKKKNEKVGMMCG